MSLLRENQWLTTNQIRQRSRCRRKVVVDAMERGDLLFEQRGRARYARLFDVLAWEEKRVKRPADQQRGRIMAGLADLL